MSISDTENAEANIPLAVISECMDSPRKSEDFLVGCRSL
jgi:hypothetical protein